MDPVRPEVELMRMHVGNPFDETLHAARQPVKVGPPGIRRVVWQSRASIVGVVCIWVVTSVGAIFRRRGGISLAAAALRFFSGAAAVGAWGCLCRGAPLWRLPVHNQRHDAWVV